MPTQPRFRSSIRYARTDQGEDGSAIMDDLLEPNNCVKKVQSNIEKFETLSLKETTSSKREEQPPTSKPSKPKGSIVAIHSTINKEPLLKITNPKSAAQHVSAYQAKGSSLKNYKRHNSTAFLQQSYLKEPAPSSLFDNAREILRGQPCQEDLIAVLQYIQFGIEGRHDFNVRVTTPKAAQIINVLVTVTIPDVWANFKQRELSEDEARMKKTVITSLGSVAGIGALLAQIKQLSSSPANSNVLSETIMVLGTVLKGHNIVSDFLNDAQNLYEKESSRRLYWQEMNAMLAGSRVLSTVAQAFSSDRSLTDSLRSYTWLGDGIEYSKWLAKNTTHASMKLSSFAKESWKFLSQLVRRGLSLGHRDIFVAEIYTKLLLGQRAFWTPIHLMLENLAPPEQKCFFDSILFDLARQYLASAGGPAVAYSHDPGIQKIVAGAAALIAGIIKNNTVLEQHVEGWLASSNGSSAVISLSSRRALVAAFGRSEEKLQRILEKSLASFGDKLQIQHVSIVQQEATAQTILLIIGYLYRIDVDILKRLSISTPAMHAVSNRLAASIPRTRLLGMIVATAVSRLVDKPENVIDFGVEEMESDDVKLWLGLISLNDPISDVTDLQHSSSLVLKSTHSVTQLNSAAKRVRKGNPPQTSKIITIEEVSDSTESEDDDLVPYKKADSDPEDSEEDATLINRNKPSAPVYIIDLIKQLQTTDKFDIISLALKTAPALIRRKAVFGTELLDNLQVLVTILVNMQEGMSEPELQQLRLESLIACIVARADLTGPSLAEVYFQGDFSLSQRVDILTAIGLAVRELAGFKDDRSLSTVDTFPSKRLPAHLALQPQHQLSAIQNPVALLMNTAAHSTIRPMALTAADKMTGPSALKIRTFSSRMEVEKKNQAKSATRTKLIPKNLHQLLTESTYIQFCSRMSLLLSTTMGGRLPNTTILHSSTIRLFLQTLTLVLHTLGPSASLHLPTITHEALLLLLNLHNIPHLATDPAVLPAFLHLLLALLDITIEAGVTAQERLITDHGARVVELVTWTNGLSDKIDVPDAEGGEGGMPWTVLAAAIQIKWFEIGKRFQGRILGLSMDEMDQLAGQ